jgi:beta-1,4-N-acetylglucosaminyltransferase
MKVMLVCSSGGHLTQLFQLREWWQQHERTWVSFDDDHTRTLLAGERSYYAYSPTTRNIPNALRNLRLAWSLLRRERPQVVVSDGAGIAVPFFMAARLLGVKTVYVEVYDRISRPTLSGRLCYPISDLFLLQWASQAASYPKGMLIGGLL